MTGGVEGAVADQPGLRERKRLATRRAIQRAVLDLSVQHGFDKVTIDEISSAADVSPRTFFNYFASKEEAIMGDLPTLASIGATADFIAGGPEESVFAGLGRLIAAAASAVTDDKESNQRRRVLLRQHPALFARRMSYLHGFEDDLTEIIVRRLQADGSGLSQDPVALARRARLMSLIAFATMRYAYSGWTENDTATPLAEYIHEAFSQLDDLLA